MNFNVHYYHTLMHTHTHKHKTEPLLSEGRREVLVTDVAIFGEESENVLEGLLSHIDTVGPVPHGARSPDTYTHIN